MTARADDAASVMAARPESRAGQAAMLIVGAPLLLMLAGVLIRYAAYASLHDAPSLAGYFDAICTWDCEWYLTIAESGYNRFPNVPAMIDHGNWAFFPLAPLVTGAVLKLLPGVPTVVIGSLLALAMSMLAVILAWPLLGRSPRAYLLFAAFVLAGPFSFYFATLLSEAPFLLLTVAVFAALHRGNYLLAGLAAALLSATRIIGVFIVFAILLEAFQRHRAGGGTLAGFVLAVLRSPDLVLAVFLAPLGLFCYMAFLHVWIGDALAFSHVQRAWAREIDNPAAYLWTALWNGPGPGSDEILGSEQRLGIAAAAGLALTGVLVWRRRFGEAVFCAIALVLPLFTGVASMIRFVSALAPLSLLAARMLAANRVVFALAFALCLVLDYVLTIAWLTGKVWLI